MLLTIVGCSSGGVKSSKLYGIDTYVMGEYNMPQDLGKPSLTDEELNSLKDQDFNNVKNQITSYIDLLRYLETKGELLNDADLYLWAKDNFENVEIVKTERKENKTKIIYSYPFVRINDNYYPLDLTRDIIDKTYLLKNKEEVGSFKEFKDYKKYISINYPHVYDKVYLIDSENMVILDNGEFSEKCDERNTECFSYYGYNIPLGLGTPKLTQEEILKLVESDDYEYIAKTISTAADAMAYVTNRFKMQSGFINSEFDGGYCVDYGNVWFDNDRMVQCTLSAAQLIDLKQAQCSAISTVMNFLLIDDYDELGYVALSSRSEGGDGHAINYAKGFDGRYYLIDASIFLYGSPSWLRNIWHNGHADTLEELMISFAASIGPWGTPIEQLTTWSYDGIWCVGEDGPTERMYRKFPDGAYNCNVWEGYLGYKYFTPKNPTDFYSYVDLSN